MREGERERERERGRERERERWGWEWGWGWKREKERKRKGVRANVVGGGGGRGRKREREREREPMSCLLFIKLPSHLLILYKTSQLVTFLSRLSNLPDLFIQIITSCSIFYTGTDTLARTTSRTNRLLVLT